MNSSPLSGLETKKNIASPDFSFSDQKYGLKGVLGAIFYSRSRPKMFLKWIGVALCLIFTPVGWIGFLPIWAHGWFDQISTHFEDKFTEMMVKLRVLESNASMYAGTGYCFDKEAGRILLANANGVHVYDFGDIVERELSGESVKISLNDLENPVYELFFENENGAELFYAKLGLLLNPRD